MSSVWEFIKRHRGKLIFGGILVGGVYVGQKFLKNSSLLESPFRSDPLTLQSRKHYVFDSNQRTCDNSVLQLIPSLKAKLQTRFDIENLLELLKNGGDKLKIWQDMKLMSFSRLFCAFYSYTLLIVSLKLQISIIAADIYEKSLENSTATSANLWGKFYANLFGGGNVSVQQKPSVTGACSASTQQIFLQALHYFITQGSAILAEKIEAIVGEVMNKISLKDELTYDQFRRIFFDIQSKIDNNVDCSKFSFFIVPLSLTNANNAASSSSSILAVEPQLEELLMLLKSLLDSRQCKNIVQFCVNEFASRTFDVCRCARKDEWFAPSAAANAREEENAKGIPLAKLIPLVSDCFHTISQTEFDSVVNNLLVSASLHEFCVKIFEKDAELLTTTPA